MSTLRVVEEILKQAAQPLTVRQIVERAGAKLPSRSKTPDTVVARDLAMDIKQLGDESKFARTAPGRYTLRALLSAGGAVVSASRTVGRAGTRSVSPVETGVKSTG